jgi:uncharacterized RDD family membrane protein YckC
MNPTEAQPEPDSTATYFDSDELDMSEEQFSASIESSFERPQFVVDGVEGVSDAVPNQPADAQIKAEPPQTLSSDRERGREPIANSPPSSEAVHDWRDQVSAKISHYKARRPLKERYPSLNLPFDNEPRERRTQSLSANLSSARDEAPTVETSPAPYQPIVLESTARVLEFPHPAPPARSDELAEAVVDRPRIIEAPELLPPPPAMGGISIQSVVESEPERRPGIDVPVESSTISRRIVAGAIDGIVISLAVAAFGYIFLRINGTLPQFRIAAEVIAGLLALLWPTYQYGFLVHSGTTPGLRLARLQVSRFDGTLAQRSLRRWRVLASLLSCVSLGLGYTWCFLDEDQLCWHDRITKTHLAPKSSRPSSTCTSA